jgi:hypothetical protein
MLHWLKASVSIGRGALRRAPRLDEEVPLKYFSFSFFCQCFHRVVRPHGFILYPLMLRGSVSACQCLEALRWTALIIPKRVILPV